MSTIGPPCKSRVNRRVAIGWGLSGEGEACPDGSGCRWGPLAMRCIGNGAVRFRSASFAPDGLLCHVPGGRLARAYSARRMLSNRAVTSLSLPAALFMGLRASMPVTVSSGKATMPRAPTNSIPSLEKVNT